MVVKKGCLPSPIFTEPAQEFELVDEYAHHLQADPKTPLLQAQCLCYSGHWQERTGTAAGEQRGCGTTVLLLSLLMKQTSCKVPFLELWVELHSAGISRELSSHGCGCINISEAQEVF